MRREQSVASRWLERVFLRICGSQLFLNGIEPDFQAPQHEIHQAFPRFKVQLSGQRRQVLKELPPRPSGGHQSGDVSLRDLPVGDEGAAVPRSSLGISDRDFAPVDFQSVVAVGERQAIGPAIVIQR